MCLLVLTTVTAVWWDGVVGAGGEESSWDFPGESNWQDFTFPLQVCGFCLVRELGSYMEYGLAKGKRI